MIQWGHARNPFAYVVAVTGRSTKLNLLDEHQGQVALHDGGISSVGQIGDLFGVVDGPRLLVMRVTALSFSEAREAHRAGVGTSDKLMEPLRHVDAVVVGKIKRTGERLQYTSDALSSAALGSEAFPLNREETATILGGGLGPGPLVHLGTDVRSGAPLNCDIEQLLGRHMAVLGSTGQGKSCFTAAVLQQLVKFPRSRIVVFDVNGEYRDALAPCVDPADFQFSELGSPSGVSKIPYYALGRHGLARLLLPSERTQRPALSFALRHLRQVEWHENEGGASLVGGRRATLFDDCRPVGEAKAAADIDRLRAGSVAPGLSWPPMRALACLVADSYAIEQGRNGPQRSGFRYGNVAPLVTRIQRCCEDELFASVVDIEGTTATQPSTWQEESAALCEKFFGSPSSTWRVHVVSLRHVAHDLMPMLLGSLLESFAYELFRRGQGGTPPTLLVLEEAHHYLRQVAGEGADGREALAYERLAKEGRKFGVSLWLSTQRPAEVSPTVLAQCGTWAVFRLTSEQDQKAVAAAGEWIDRSEVARVAGLGRQECLVFGGAVSLPTRVFAPTATPLPVSQDPSFSRWAST